MIEEILKTIPKRKLAHNVLDYLWDKGEAYQKDVLQKRKQDAKEQAELKKQIEELLKKLK